MKRMEKRLKIFFDKKGDALDIVVRIDPKTKEIMGFTILNFEKRFEHEREETLPITATFAQVEEPKPRGNDEHQ
jgi:hypothetical protein